MAVATAVALMTVCRFKVQMKYDYATKSHLLTYHTVLLRRLGELCFLNLGVKGLSASYTSGCSWTWFLRSCTETNRTNMIRFRFFMESGAKYKCGTNPPLGLDQHSCYDQWMARSRWHDIVEPRRPTLFKDCLGRSHHISHNSSNSTRLWQWPRAYSTQTFVFEIRFECVWVCLVFTDTYYSVQVSILSPLLLKTQCFAQLRREAHQTHS